MARAWLVLAGIMSVSAALQELPGYKTQFEVLKAGDGRSAGDSLRAAINLRLLPLPPLQKRSFPDVPFLLTFSLDGASGVAQKGAAGRPRDRTRDGDSQGDGQEVLEHQGMLLPSPLLLVVLAVCSRCLTSICIRVFGAAAGSGTEALHLQRRSAAGNHRLGPGMSGHGSW